MTASIGFQSELITGTDFFVAALYDTSDVSTVLESQQVPKSGGIYPPDFQVTFLYNLIQDRVYRCILWESPNATPTGISRVSGDFKPSLNGINMRGSLYLTGGFTPGMTAGTAGYVDPTNSLAGWTYDLEQIGFGTLKLGRDYTVDPTTGNWTLINGTTIGDQQDFVVHFQPQATAAPQPPVSAITSGRIITNSLTLTGADKNKALYIQATGSNITVTLPPLSSLANYDMVVIYCIGGNQISASFPTQGTDKILYGGLRTQLALCQGETLKLLKANGVYNVDNGPLFGVDNVGQLVDSYVNSMPNTVLADGRELNRADYARLFAWAQTTGAIISTASWGSISGGKLINKGFFYQGDGTTTFGIPDLRVYGNTKAVGGSIAGPGVLEPEMVGSHNHPIHWEWNGTDGTTNNGKLIYNGDGEHHGSGIDNTAVQVNSGTEQRLNATGVYRLIRI